MATPDLDRTKHDTVMDVTEELVARVYAKALMGVTAKSANADDLVAELSSVVSDVLDSFPKLETTLRSSLVGQEQKEQLLDRIFGKRASNLHFSVPQISFEPDARDCDCIALSRKPTYNMAEANFISRRIWKWS